jgi:hypothetical protein
MVKYDTWDGKLCCHEHDNFLRQAWQIHAMLSFFFQDLPWLLKDADNLTSGFVKYHEAK